MQKSILRRGSDLLRAVELIQNWTLTWDSCFLIFVRSLLFFFHLVTPISWLKYTVKPYKSMVESMLLRPLKNRCKTFYFNESDLNQERSSKQGFQSQFSKWKKQQGCNNFFPMLLIGKSAISREFELLQFFYSIFLRKSIIYYHIHKCAWRTRSLIED